MATWAVIKTGGKQYKITEGDKIDIEKIVPGKSNTMYFDQILLINQDNKLILGKPFIKKAKVRAKIIKNFKTSKILVVKFKPKSRYLRTTGHRQIKTHLLIEKIQFK